ncbi:MAG: hypothetical protein WAP23_03895 [Candidatus Spechtbacterales bacterium]
MDEDTGIELEEDFGAPEERQRILSALRGWAQSYPDQNAPVYITGIDMRITPGEIVKHIEDETAIGVAILDLLVMEARKFKKFTKSEIVIFLGSQFPLTLRRIVDE